MHIIYCQNKGVGVAIMWKIDYLFMITRVRDSNAMAMWYTITNLTSTGVRSIPRSRADPEFCQQKSEAYKRYGTEGFIPCLCK
jgi:hypothetical protein